MSSEIKSTTVQTNSLKNKTGTRVLAADSGSAWSWGSSVPKGSVIEQICSPCDGSSITVQSGTYTVPNVTSPYDLTTTYNPLDGSVIDYTPPTGTQTVVYSINFHYSLKDAHNICNIKLYLDNDSGTETEVTDFRASIGGEGYLEGRYTLKWAFHIGGSNNDASGRRATWTSPRTMQYKIRENDSDTESKYNTLYFWEAGNSGTLVRPLIEITALA